MTGQRAVPVRSQRSVVEKGRITYNQIETAFRWIIYIKISFDGVQPVGPRGIAKIQSSLFHRFPTDIDTSNFRFGKTLGNHQGNKSGTAADVKNSARTCVVARCAPGAKKHPVGTYFHCAPMISDIETLEMKNCFSSRISHKRYKINEKSCDSNLRGRKFVYSLKFC